MTDLPLTLDPRPMGPAGTEVFPLGYGCWRFAGTGVSEARAKVEDALDLGLNLFDTADIYGWNGNSGWGAAEELLGQVFADAPTLREKIFLATKGGIVPGMPYNSTAEYLIKACEDSLKRLQVDMIDLYQIHRPDLLAHPEDVADALSRLQDQGKIAHVGVSNYTVSQFNALQDYLDDPILSHQPEFSAWELSPMRNGLFDQCMQEEISVLAWSPLAGGRLATGVGEFDDPAEGARFKDLIAALDRLAEKNSTTRTAIALAFVLTHPAGIIPIIGTQKTERIKEALEAFNVELTRSDWYDIVEASEGAKLP